MPVLNTGADKHSVHLDEGDPVELALLDRTTFRPKIACRGQLIGRI